MNMISAPTTAHTSSAFGMPSVRPVASRRIRSVARSCGAKPPVCSTMRPCATALMPSVKIIDGMRRYAVPRPLSRPSTAPQRMPKGIAHGPQAAPQPAEAVAITPPTVTSQGTDRSIAPSRITSIAPVAMMPRKAAIWSCSSR